MSLSVLDVGHGSCAIVEDGEVVAVIDGGRDSTFLRYLREEVLERLDLVILSHADADHIRGLGLALKALPELTVGAVLVNPAQAKRTVAWASLVEHLELRQRRDGTGLGPLRSDSGSPLRLGDRCTFEVLSPAYVQVLGPHDVNRMSGVIRVLVNGVAEALLTADVDRNTVEHLVATGVPMTAPILVFPHHGGNAGGDMKDFARLITKAVQPRVALMSVGRNVFGNPLPEVVNGILTAGSDVHIACTQLSRRCSDDLPRKDPAHLSGRIAAGARSRRCCIGTLTLTVDDSGSRSLTPSLEEHTTFVKVNFPARLCASD